MKIVISSGHGKYVRGASHENGLDEVDEARRVVPEVVHWLKLHGHKAVEFHDDTSTTQDQNLHAIVAAHNAETRDLDVSVHFNCYTWTSGARGCEVCYVSDAAKPIASAVSQAMAEAAGFINRGAKYRSDLYFLNKTERPAILLEVCFVDAAVDIENYRKHFEALCEAIADVAPQPDRVDPRVLRLRGLVSWFGGPNDMGVTPSEGLALEAEGVNPDDKPNLFLKSQPPGTTGNARRLDPSKPYLAVRWNYEQFSKERLAGDEVALVRAIKTGKEAEAHPADWGPHEQETGRAADISPGLMERLGLQTDDEVEVIYPHRA
jgi:N-acetylmuramoyl-L-alanine amidase